jgi:transcriptional regulator with XRE-family HTH domain
VTNSKPTTTEGDLLRERRELLGLTVEQACEGTPLGRNKWGDVERGRTRARKGLPAAVWHAPAPVVAIMAARLGVLPAELTQADRADAARILEREAAHPTPVRAVPTAHALGQDVVALVLDKLFAALIRDRPDSEVLEFLWRDIDGEGNLRPIGERMQSVVDWLDDRRGRQAEAARPSESHYVGK